MMVLGQRAATPRRWMAATSSRLATAVVRGLAATPVAGRCVYSAGKEEHGRTTPFS